MGKAKFEVTLQVDALYGLPFQTAIVYCKVKHPSGPSYTSRHQVKDNVVRWGEAFTFTASMKVGKDAVVASAPVRVSVRRETEGGLKHVKLGYVNVDLAEFVGMEGVERKCLLNSDKESLRQDNSMLKVIVSSRLIQGSPVFKPLTRNSPRASMMTISDAEDGVSTTSSTNNPAHPNNASNASSRPTSLSLPDERAYSRPSLGSMAALPLKAQLAVARASQQQQQQGTDIAPATEADELVDEIISAVDFVS